MFVAQRARKMRCAVHAALIVLNLNILTRSKAYILSYVVAMASGGHIL